MPTIDNQSSEENSSAKRLLKIATITDEFEGYAHPHATRIAVIGEQIARRFDLGTEDCSILRQAALVHDLGEVVMNRDYIKKKGVLSEEERLDLQRHPVIGEQEAAKRGLTRAVQLLVRWHHEWWNGEGYPDALRNEEIPLMARIIRVADTYCAITDNRPHSPAIPTEDAKMFLQDWAGLEFDPKVVRAFLEISDLPEIESYYGVSDDTGESNPSVNIDANSLNILRLV